MKSEDMKISVYISINPSTMAQTKAVQIEDVASVFCSDPDIKYQVKKTELFTFHDNEQGQVVISALAIIGEILKTQRHVSVSNLGSPECVVYYRNLPASKKWIGTAKGIFLILLAFFGTAYSIMSYNGDVGAVDLLKDLYQMFTGDTAKATQGGYSFGILSYCAGLFIGMMTFFNHGFNHKKTDDPTPLQVQMRLYEKDVNDAIVVDSSRKGNMIDVD